tara:strand:+ start:755 stop:1030 length:276 start_codon:yes stop_codon:yes gene_type:complete
MAKRATWTKDGTEDGVTGWSLYLDGVYAGSLERQRPTRYQVGARLGLARDNSKPYDYDGEAINEADDVLVVEFPEGVSLREAKALVVAAAC